MKKFIFLTLALLLALPIARTDEDEGKKLRAFLHDVIVDTGIESENQADALRRIFANHAEILPLLLDQNTFTQLMSDANLSGALAKVTGGNTIRDILEDTIETQVLLWMKSIERADSISNEMLKEHIMIAQRFLRRIEEKQATKETMEKTKKGAIRFTKEFSNIPTAERFLILKLIPDAAFNVFASRFNRTIESSNFSKLGVLDPVLNDKNGIQLPGVSKEEAQALSKAFKEYFDHLPIQDKRKIIAAWMQLPPNAAMETQLAEVLQNSGPVMQKIFQLFGRDSQSPEVRAIMQELLSNVKPFDSDLAKVMIEQSLQKPITDIFASFDDQPIAAGTIGQVHKAKLKDGTQVVVKVLRPGIKNQMDREFQTMKTLISGNPAAEEILKRLQQNFLEELDFRNELKNLKSSQVYTDKKLGLNVPQVVAEIPTTETVLVSKLAPGKPLSSLGHLPPEIRGQAIYNALKKWTDEVMFGSGFFHGDMHPGNLLLAERPGQNPPFLLTIIDPGSAGTLSLSQRKNLVRLFFGITSKNAESTLDALKNFGKIPSSQEKNILNEIQALLKNSTSVELAANDIIKQALRLGIELDPSLLMFQRANMFLVKELDKINEELLTKNPKAKLFNATNAYLSVGLRRASISIPKQFFSATARSEAVIETGLLRQFFIDKLKHQYQHVKLSCRQWFSNLR